MRHAALRVASCDCKTRGTIVRGDGMRVQGTTINVSLCMLHINISTLYISVYLVTNIRDFDIQDLFVLLCS